MTGYAQQAWGGVQVGDLVRGGDGHDWVVTGMEPSVRGGGWIIVTVERFHDNAVVVRTKTVRHTDTVSLKATAPEPAPEPPAVPETPVYAPGDAWVFPVMNSHRHLQSHLFLIHGDVNLGGDLARRHRAAHETDPLPPGTVPHYHQPGEAG